MLFQMAAMVISIDDTMSFLLLLLTVGVCVEVSWRSWVESKNAPAIFARLPAIIPSVLANVLVAISKAN